MDVIPDKGLVIDVSSRVSLLRIELLPVAARIVIARVDTYLRFAELATASHTWRGREGHPATGRGHDS